MTLDLTMVSYDVKNTGDKRKKQINFIKPKTFCASKDITKEVKDNPQ